MGGEKPRTLLFAFSRSGSPPHGRGKADAEAGIAERLGITPAWAGKRACTSASKSSDQDHPRMGGEKTSTFGWQPGNRGSPPHGRGKAP